ncbi:PhoX family phosphatase [Salinisphaera sp. W335]|uniref:PhoX family phosphatase n=2 Tax=Spectribacter hydrogenoxidans TaxID=3075608 RepID=A0ABU3BX85_9GAMM|nr:PhoX family phosphatase [Salinisphaera sp. W335]MDT0633908.1 PhoX family phosphatase [Salinisphaera sp. W335]
MTRNRPPILDPDTIKEMEGSLSNSRSEHFSQILEARVSRRDTLRGGLGLAATTIFAGAGLSACGGDSNGGGNTATPGLSFNSIAGSSADAVSIPDGYRMQALIPWGTPITGSFPAYAGDGTNTAAEQAQQIGANHDGMTFFPLPEGSGSSTRGLLVINHEYTNPTLFAGDGRATDMNGAPTDADEVRKDINAHGVSVVEIAQGTDRNWGVIQGGFNRRITAATPMMLSGPAAGSEFMVTAYDNSGMTTRGTVNNCGRGFTPWGTYLTCEENIQGYFITTEANPPREKARYGLTDTGFGYLWSNVAGDPTEVNGEFARFDTTPSGPEAASDYRNEANTFGWLVEIDPFNPAAAPVKRTAMGRFRHEGAEPGRIVDGRPIAFYMGDDARGEYIYKFVTAEAWDPTQPNPNMLDNGTLYVARLSADGSGEWLTLDYDNNPALANDFTSQADVLVNTRTAADVLGATPMDRPEWSTTDPNTGEIYFTLTNNTNRGPDDTDAANPRGPNTHGHVIRLAENDDNPAATGFVWDIFVFGSNANADPSFNISGLTLDNEFGGPDGLWFDRRGVLWVQTDNGAPLDSDTNDQMLAVVPAQLAGDRTVNPDTQASLKRFFVGPVGCEVTGVEMTPDYRTMFVNIQHPGGNWPDGGSARPRSATVVISREDDGEIAL